MDEKQQISAWYVLIAVLFGNWSFAIRRMHTSRGMMSVGKSKAKVYVETDTQVSFDDVADVEEAKEELREVVNFLQYSDQCGRLDSCVPKGILLVGPPGTDRIGRAAILRAHINEVKLAAVGDIETVAALTPSYTGADLANLGNEAALLATRRGGYGVTPDDFTRAIERIVAELERKSRLLNPKGREVAAYHEMGHARVAMSRPGVDPGHKNAINPRGTGARGYTIQRQMLKRAAKMLLTPKSLIEPDPARLQEALPIAAAMRAPRTPT